MKRMFLTLMTALSLITSLTMANAAERIVLDPGGSIGAYAQKYVQGRIAESKYVIDGLCLSACTMITGNIPKDNVCATQFGVLGFHSAYSTGPGGEYIPSPEGTRIMGQMLSDEVKVLLRAKGFDPDEGQDHPDLIYIKALQFYKACNNG